MQCQKKKRYGSQGEATATKNLSLPARGGTRPARSDPKPSHLRYRAAMPLKRHKAANGRFEARIENGGYAAQSGKWPPPSGWSATSSCADDES